MKQSALVVPADDPQPSAAWKIQYDDTFDRETPSSVEVAGKGLYPGLVELWARFLFETVQGGSMRGFSEFSLWIPQLIVRVDGDMTVAHKMKQWVFGSATTSMHGVLDEVRRHDLLDAIARCHARELAPHFPDAIAREAWVPTSAATSIFECAARATSADEFVGLLNGR